jgi:hypothetical protein
MLYASASREMPQCTWFADNVARPFATGMPECTIGPADWQVDPGRCMTIIGIVLHKPGNRIIKGANPSCLR